MNTFGELREIVPRDPAWRTVEDMDRAFFPHPWDAKDWSSLGDHAHVFVWFTDLPIGFCLLQWVPGDDTAHLIKIVVLPEFQGSGHGWTFFQRLCVELRSRSLKKVYLEVSLENQRALNFYEKVGFERLNLIKKFYSTGEDAWTMSMTL